MILQRAAIGVGIQRPETSLAAAVVQQAWDDLVRPIKADTNGTTTVTAVDRAQAIRFCCDAGGDWAAAREHWCLAAGIDPDVLRERAMARRNAGGRFAAPKGSVGVVPAEVAGSATALACLPRAGLPPATCAAGASASAAAFSEGR